MMATPPAGMSRSTVQRISRSLRSSSSAKETSLGSDDSVSVIPLYIGETGNGFGGGSVAGKEVKSA
jgi:hypothetical protein